jgi:hypothetical protein
MIKKNDRNKFVKIKRPYVAKLNEVIISKGDTYAEIRYKEKNVSGVRLEFGKDISKMTKKEILDEHNRVLFVQLQMRTEKKFIAKEIPTNQPQIEFHENSQQWVPRGDVLRSIIQDPDLSLAVEIDDRLLNLEEFGRMLTTYAGWGMRIIFVPEDEIFCEPKIKIEDPDEKQKKKTF